MTSLVNDGDYKTSEQYVQYARERIKEINI